MKNTRITIFDTTLRDGEQCPGASMNLREKLEVARQLARLKVDVIEAGFPVISDGDFSAVNTIAKEVMLGRTSIPEAPWWVVKAVDKKRARLNCIRHLLSLVPYTEVQHNAIHLPERLHHPDYHRHDIPLEMLVPEFY